jgi:uncharacterized phage protein (TIGR01671 family)
MRPIKFRQWIKGKFNYWGIGLDECTFVGPSSGSGGNASNTPQMQFTGLVDVEGKEIYEEDIVVSEDYPFYSDGLLNYVGVVYWDNDELTYFYEIKAVSDRVCGRACDGNLSEHDWKVVGNTYENPELLTSKPT